MSQSYFEKPVSFSMNGRDLYGILSVPEVEAKAAVIIVVGGPQYRVGSHRQFALLARCLAAQGILALRFDYTGMGYSQGISKQFYEIDDDVKVAIDFVFNHECNLDEVYLWGLCDAAAAISFTAYTDDRIKGVVLLNPWVRSETSHSKAILHSYYRERLFSIEVWKQLLLSPSKISKAIFSLGNIVFKILSSRSNKSKFDAHQVIPIADREENIAEAVFRGMSNFNGSICLILSGKDLVADEFKQMLDENDWLLDEFNRSKTVIHYIDEADHTFSSRKLRSEVEQITLNFVNS
ncbi:MAG: hydrolase 1, exosortase A system-associated [Gammaproteobacteria bacterium]|nr:hydrolase 1, exosortase A system-associated [Gammaproteobacteria bacterium]